LQSVCVIPARYGSTRLPGKPLRLIGDKPMIQWVFERASMAKRITRVLVATDHEEILSCVQGFGGNAVMTSSDLESGTDRVAEAVKNVEADVVINVQGDEPFISPALLDDMVEVFNDPQVEIATAMHRITKTQDLKNPNLVRVTHNKDNFALYFSRSVIPFYRDDPDQESWLEHTRYFRHIGLYAYRKNTLMALTRLPVSELEQAERLEQLRWLENGFSVYTLETEYESMCVDTPEDLQKLNELLNSNRLKPDEIL